jgi:hypothetical protein
MSARERQTFPSVEVDVEARGNLQSPSSSECEENRSTAATELVWNVAVHQRNVVQKGIGSERKRVRTRGKQVNESVCERIFAVVVVVVKRNNGRENKESRPTLNLRN